MSGKSLPKSPTASEKFITPADKIISLLSFSHITEIPTVNDYRNPIVAEAMKEMKYVNMFNQGIRRVQDMLRENGNPEAEFSVDKLTAFEVIVRSTDMENLEKSSDGGKDGRKGSGCIITDKQAIILQLLKENGSLTAIDLAGKTGMGERSIYRELANLQELGLILRAGGRKNGHWEVLK